jgi:hypothetical protein
MTMKCPNCGTENPEGKRFCGDCGTILPPPTPPVQPAQPTPTLAKQSWLASNWKVLAVVVVVVLVVLSLAVTIPVRITVNLSCSGFGYEHVRIYIDDQVVYEAWISQAPIHESFSVNVGHHTVVVTSDGETKLREVVMAWPFIGTTVTGRYEIASS